MVYSWHVFSQVRIKFFPIGDHDSSLNKPDTSTMPLSNFIATVNAPVFGRHSEFGEQFAGKYEFQSFRQLVKTATSMNRVQKETHKQNGSTGIRSPYSYKCYGRKPIEEQFFPLKKDVTIFLDFERFDNFGSLEWN